MNTLRTNLVFGVLALPALALLAGCSGSDEPVASPSASAPAEATGPACPSAEDLFALLPATGTTLDESARPFCAGDWALIGVRDTNTQSVALFRHVDNAWKPQDTAEACASGDLPSEMIPSACNAG